MFSIHKNVLGLQIKVEPFPCAIECILLPNFNALMILLFLGHLLIFLVGD